MAISLSDPLPLLCPPRRVNLLAEKACYGIVDHLQVGSAHTLTTAAALPPSTDQSPRSYCHQGF